MLPDKLGAAFEALSQGRHVCATDTDLFRDLQERTEDYKQVFSALGFRLDHDARGFFYFHGSAGGLAQDSERIALFMFILVDWLNDKGEGLDALFGRAFTLDDLPHMASDRYRGYLRQTGVEDAEGLRKVVSRMARFGFADDQGGGRFRFLPPIHRLLDACIEMAARLDARNEDENGSDL